MGGGFKGDALPHSLHVKIDGKRFDDTPLHVRLPAGGHRLEVWWEGYRAAELPITIKAGKPVQLSVRLGKRR